MQGYYPQIVLSVRQRTQPRKAAAPSPVPRRILSLDPIRRLLERGVIVIAAGGGGITAVRGSDSENLRGVEAVIDKDLCSALLARELHADCLVIATDVGAVYLDWGLPEQRALVKTSPQALTRNLFAAGSMGPKVGAAGEFVQTTGKRAVIGTAGTQIVPDFPDSPTSR